MKKILTFVFALLLMFSLVSCGKVDDNKDKGGNNQETTDPVVEVDKTVSGFSVESTTKVYLTSIGQADFDIVGNLVDKQDTKGRT